jgi:FMN phosphatase YigB (HAD superfamily)
MRWFGEIDLSDAAVLLCDADGTLFPSEEPAFEASATVTNTFLQHLGAARRFTPAELQAMTNGKNFRASATELAAAYGRELDDDALEGWVADEKEAVTRHLRTVLEYDEGLSRLCPASRAGSSSQQ